MTDNPYKTIRLVLPLCIELERTAGKIYRELAILSQSIPEVSKVLRQAASEEENHANQFVLCQKMSRNNELIVDIDMAQAENVLQSGQKLLLEIQNHSIELLPAIQLCVQMEKNLLEFHMGGAIRFKDQDIQKLFAAMMKNDQAHIDILKRFADH